MHSFAGIGLGEGSVKELCERVMGKQQIRKRWMYCRALVIDEVSMLDGSLVSVQAADL